MIQYSFSPNWYRPQCLGFSQKKSVFYYSSNCIIYKYDLDERRIVSELNLKNWLIKKQGYNLGTLNKKNVQKQSLSQNKNEQKQSQSVHTNKNKQLIERQRILKISSIKLIESQTYKQDIIVVGFNCIGLLVIIESKSENGEFIVKGIIDLTKQTNTQITGVQYIYVDKQVIKTGQKKKINQTLQNSIKLDIFSIQGVKINLKLNINSQVQNINNIHQYKLFQLLSWNKIIQNNSKKYKNLQIKAISKQSYQINSTQQNKDSQNTKQHFYTVFLANNIYLNNTQQNKSTNIIIYDSKFQNIIKTSNINSIFSQNQKDQLNQQLKNNKSIQQTIQNIISVDFIQTNNINKNKKYIVLTKPQANKQNMFCQIFYLYNFSSSTLLQSINIYNNTLIEQNNTQQKSQQKVNRIKVQIIYPKKIHHKLTQQQKSTLSIKFINQNHILFTARLGQMIIINLKQIQLQSITDIKRKQFKITIKPYSYQEENNQLWRIQHTQRHYKDVYGIYRLKNQYKNNMSNQQQDDNYNKLYLIGTDHILTTWKSSNNPQLDINNQQLLSFESNIKFLTSSVDQIILSQLQPSLVFLRLRDSNIRSFQPYTDRSYWLNQFWKHTNSSFTKQIQKLVIHPKDIGIVAMVNKQGIITIYDLYEQRLIRLIEIKQINHKINKDNKNNKNNKDNKNNQNKSIKQQKTNTKQNQKNKHNTQTSKAQKELKPIQINSISFQHISILKSLQSLYTLYPIQQLVINKNQFDMRSQQFYQKVLDKDTVLMIQSNEFILVLVQNPQQPRNMKFQLYKKVFKLQRVYKTKYWDGNVLIGTRKKKGQLMVGISVAKSNKEKQNKLLSDMSYKSLQSQPSYISIQREINLPLGVSSRYIFKLSTYINDKGQNNYMLNVINYKNNKLCLAFYSLTINKKNKLETQKDHQVQDEDEKVEGQNNKQKLQLQLELNEIIVSEQMIIPNLQSHTQSSISIQHLIVSQQQNEYLIGIYNNVTETITIINYSHLVNKAIQYKLKHQQQQPLLQNIYQKEQNRQLNKQQRTQQITCKRTIQQVNKHQHQLQQHVLIKTSLNSTNSSCIELSQFSQLSYKIESMMFNSVYSDKQINIISHLIILGKDQSVRLLNLNQHLNKQNYPNSTTNKLQNMQQFTNLYKVHHKTLQLKSHYVHNSQSQQKQ